MPDLACFSYNRFFQMSTFQRVAIIVITMSYYHNVLGDMTKMSKKSHVEDFEGVTVLFEALTTSPNDDNCRISQGMYVLE
ncbi:uncharacterized protein LOC117567601 [Drosophila albomicans]|uniref:Uncharacterized protein LOC117567601 n=1 Tax=Drosophila albomicans TaxID=7291 RepID=A0A9C6SP21_DROAB|nr:uncharacterized protein LOC117567601 [Drosophila albomicans]